MYIRETLDSDIDDILMIETLAFGSSDESRLVKNLLNDSSAIPLLSLMALEERNPVGHILFTSARLVDTVHNAKIVILAPIAVVPDSRNRGIGGKLINKGLEILSLAGIDLVFVFGAPLFYQKHGFKPACQYGLEPPYPIPKKNSDYWMVQALNPGVLGSVTGRVKCADSLDLPGNWRIN